MLCIDKVNEYLFFMEQSELLDREISWLRSATHLFDGDLLVDDSQNPCTAIQVLSLILNKRQAKDPSLQIPLPLWNHILKDKNCKIPENPFQNPLSPYFIGIGASAIFPERYEK